MPCWFYLNLLLCICNIFIKTKTDVYVLYIMDVPYSSIKFSVCLAGWVAGIRIHKKILLHNILHCYSSKYSVKTWDLTVPIQYCYSHTIPSVIMKFVFSFLCIIIQQTGSNRYQFHWCLQYDFHRFSCWRRFL